MRGAKLNNGVSSHLQENLWLYVVCLLCLFTGIVLGIYTVRYMGNIEKQDLINYFLNFKENIKYSEVDKKYILLEAIKNNIPIIIGLWILGLTIVGIPVVLIIDIIKGFALGYTISFILNSLGVNGLWFILIGVLPQNLIYLPCIIAASVISMKLSMVKLKDRANKQVNYNKNYLINYCITFFIILLCMILGFLYEAYITPGAIKAVAMQAESALC